MFTLKRTFYAEMQKSENDAAFLGKKRFFIKSEGVRLYLLRFFMRIVDRW